MHVEMKDVLIVRTRTGRETHYAYLGSTVTFCGKRLKAMAGQMVVRGLSKPSCLYCSGQYKR